MFFNLGPFEIVVLIVVGLIVFGPDRLPTLAKDAARMLRTVRELAQGARTSLRDELGPEFGDLDLRKLNPRTAIQRAIFDDDDDDDEPVRSASSTAYSPGAPIEKPVTRVVASPLEPEEKAPYDADAT